MIIIVLFLLLLLFVGMLFDHGCDSVITWVMALMTFNCLGIGQNFFSYFALVFMSQISFYMAQWS